MGICMSYSNEIVLAIFSEKKMKEMSAVENER